MQRLLSIALSCLFAVSLSAQEPSITYPYNPDADHNNTIGTPDLLGFLGIYGEYFQPDEIMIDNETLYEIITQLQDALLSQSEQSNNTYPCQNESSVNYYGIDYSLIEIGNQCWFGENLKSVKYSNGDDINTTTQTNIEGLHSFYLEEISDYENEQTGFYSPLVVWDSRNVCPSGYHIPTWEDWTQLIAFLGPCKGGYLLKNNQLWGGPNDYNFSAKPLGVLRASINYDIDNYQQCISECQEICDNSCYDATDFLDNVIENGFQYIAEEVLYGTYAAQDYGIQNYIGTSQEEFLNQLENFYIEWFNNNSENSDINMALIEEIMEEVYATPYIDFISSFLSMIIEQYELLDIVYDEYGEWNQDQDLMNEIEELIYVQVLDYMDQWDLNVELAFNHCQTNHCFDLDDVCLNYCGEEPTPYLEAFDVYQSNRKSTYYVKVDDNMVDYYNSLGSEFNIMNAITGMYSPFNAPSPRVQIYWLGGEHFMELAETMSISIWGESFLHYSPIRCVKD